MTQNPVGLFIQWQGVSNRQSVIDHCVKANYRTVSGLDDFEACRQLKNTLPDCIIIHRSSTFEPLPGQNYRAALTSYLNGIESQDKRIVIMVNCENGYSSEHCQMWANMIAIADGMGWKLCVGGMSSGSVKSGQGNDSNDWMQAAPLFTALNSLKGHYLQFHEYTFPFPWSVSNGEFGTPNNQPDKLDWSKPQWHIGRNVQGIQNACKQLGLTPPQCIVTETLIDTMNDIVSHFGMKADGYKTLTAKWQEWYPGKDRGDVLADMHQWAWEKAYAPCGFVVGTHTYCYGDASGEKQRWQDYRVDNEPRYLQRMEAYRSFDTSTPPPTVPFDYGDMNKSQIQITNAKINTLNLRANPSTDSTVLKQVLDGDFVLYSQNGLKSGDFTWFKVISAGITGFLAKTPNYDVVPVITPTPHSPPETAKQAILDAIASIENDLAGLVGSADNMHIEIERLKALIDNDV